MQFQKYIKECLELTDRPLSPGNEDRKKEITAKWTTWLYIDCCWDTCPTCQSFPTLMVSGIDLVDENSLTEFFHESGHFL